MMERNEIIGQLRNLIVENLELAVPKQLSETDRIYEDLNIDSIMVLQLMVYIEETFHVSIPEEDVDPSVFQTLGSLVSFIQELKSKQ
ncbi:phosphopantetheine-binding protein [Paenibacillus sp. GCM10027628]|uniref:phosphopantetheine-binding protein n=1 Tax=Paenibacillus sp. GCM10027628 TaxID=3273413 RepID=UPI003632AE39